MKRRFVTRLTQPFARLRRNERGNVLILTAMSLPILIGGAGFGIDTVQWYLWQRELQIAVDSAALSGAHSRSQGKPFEPSVNAELARNADTISISSKSSELTSWGAAGNNAIMVTASTQKDLPFSRMLGVSAPRLEASATAAIIRDGHHCMVSLDPTTAEAIKVSGSALVKLGCGISSNSQHEKAIVFDGSAKVEASPISAVGGILAGDDNLQGTSTIRPYAMAQQDPFGTLSPPANPPLQTFVANGQNKTTLLKAGTYKQDITINDKTGMPMEKGLFVIDGPYTLRVNGQASLIGSEVTIVLKNGATIDFNGGSEINLSASTETTPGVPSNLVGMVIYDADPPSAPVSTSRINGNNTLRLSGAVYMPRQNVEILGNADPVTNCLLLVANRVSVSGNASITNTCSGSPPYMAKTGVDVVRLVK